MNKKATHCEINVAHEVIAHIHTAEGVPQLHFDQLNVIANHLYALQGDTGTWTPLSPSTDTMHYAVIYKVVPVLLKQHDAYKAQQMFGNPIPPPKQYVDGKQVDITILPFVWK